jgi:hypothetical protein
MNLEGNFFPNELYDGESCFYKSEDSSRFKNKETSNFLGLNLDYSINVYNNMNQSCFLKKLSKTIKIPFQTPLTYENDNEPTDESIKNIINFQNDITLLNNNVLFGNLTLEKDSEGKTKSQFPDDNIFVHRRKWSNDSIHKKIKRFFFKYIQNKFSVFLSRKPPKIPQKVVSDVTIKFNKFMFNLNIEEFYQKFCDFDIMKLINKKMKSGEAAKEFSKYMLHDLYYKYIQDQFDTDIDRICCNESSEYYEKMKQKSRKFVEYFLKLEPFQKKQF